MPIPIGFRAGTCTPFLFYDLDYEIQTPLNDSPLSIDGFCIAKTQFFARQKRNLIKGRYSEVQKVNGLFTFIYSTTMLLVLFQGGLILNICSILF